MIRACAALLLSVAAAQAQTVTPATFGLNLLAPTTDTLHIAPSIQRMWDSSASGSGVHWADIETARGVYSWTAFDAILANYVGKGEDVIYTFGHVPGWANGNAGQNVPPSNFQDFYDFVMAVTTRAAGRIKYYGAWNEANDAADYWSGTVAQMVTLASNVYSIVHANAPGALVMTPSGAVNGAGTSSGIPWLQSYLAAGGGAYADVVDMHLYFLSNATYNPLPATTPPEQYWLAVQDVLSAMSGAGISTLPLIVDEGSFGTPTYSPTALGQLEISATWPILLASGGVSRMLWYVYDGGSGGWGNLINTDAIQSLNGNGTAFREAQKWLMGATFSSPVARVATTNQIRNPSGSGAVAGTPGTAPTDWSVYNPDSGHGISTSIVGTGTEGGVAYVDVRLFGTETSGGTGQVQIFFETSQQIAATSAQNWTLSGYFKVAAGSMTGVLTDLEYNENNASGGYLATGLAYPFYPSGAALQTGVQAWQAQPAAGSLAYVQPYLNVAYSVGTPIDVTVRIGAPSMDTGSIWSGTITKPGGYQGQIVWDAGQGPTSYAASGTYTYQRDATGGSRPIVGGSVVLTGQPTLLENTQWMGWAP